MKKLFILLITIFALSCSEDDKECKCNKARMTTFTPGPINYFYINNLPIDCNTGKPNNEWLLERNYIYVNCEE